MFACYRQMISGSSTSLRPSGIGRYVTAAFLSVWLVGWVMGEAFAITMLGAMFGSIAGVFSEGLPAWSADLATSGGAAFVLLFLLFWLTLWTVGGIAALTHLMRSLAGEDVIGLKESGFEVVRRAVPSGGATRSIEPRFAASGRVRRTRPSWPIPPKGTRVITTFGLPAERDE